MISVISRKEQEKEARKQDIINAAARLFAQKDFHSVTVDEIAEQVGLSKGTIYLYFENKEKLFFSILIARTKALMKGLMLAVQSKDTFEVSLEKFILTFFEFFQKHEAYFKLIHSEKTRSSIEAHYQMHEAADKIAYQFITVISQLLQKGIDSNVVRSKDIISMAKMLAGMLNTFTFYRIFAISDSTPAEDTKIIIDLFLNGIKKNVEDR